MRHTELWARMEAALGAGYARHWASQTVLPSSTAGLRWRRSTAGETPKDVWLAVWRALELPAGRPVTLPTPTDLAAVQRHTVRVLIVSQAVGALGMTIGFATAALLARDISGSDTQSGLVQTSQVLGAAVASYLLARLMSRRGRRVGLVTGYLIGATGSVLAVAGGVAESMTLLLLGAALLGATSAANNSSRYAATDLAAEHSRARALSIVVWASTIGAVAGPNLTGFGGWTARQLSLPELTGPFAVGTVGILAAGLVLFVALRPDPLQLARQAADVPVVSHTSWRKAFTVVRERPLLLAAMVVMAGAHAAMIMVMVMTPLHMAHGGADLEIIGVVISVHVLGMFAFAPVAGIVTDRVGRAPAAMAGATLLLVALRCVVGLARGHLLAGVRRPVPARPGLVVLDRGGLDADHRQRATRLARRHPGPLRPRHGAGGGRGERPLRADRRRVGLPGAVAASRACCPPRSASRRTPRHDRRNRSRLDAPSV